MSDATTAAGAGQVREPPGADAILLDRRGAVLMVLRDAKPTIPYPNTWALLGGYLEPGETPAQALVREIREEIGIELPPPLLFREYRWPECTEFIFWQWLEIEPQRVALTEGQRLSYFHRDALAGLRFASHYGRILDDFFASEVGREALRQCR